MRRWCLHCGRTGDGGLTRALASTMAPFLSRQRTTSTCPALAAMWRAVSPRWRPESTDSSNTPPLCLYRGSAVEETHDVADVGRSSALQQQQHDVQVAHKGCHVDGGQAGLGGEHSVSVPGVAGEGGVDGCGWGHTSVMAWMEAPYLTSSSITFTRFFLQAMWSGVKPF